MATPPPGTELIVRPSGRAFVIDPEFRALMIGGSDPRNPERGQFWWTPGGGLNEGEELAAGTRRELWEELGLVIETDEELGPLAMTRRSVFSMDGVWFDSYESFFIVPVEAGFEPKAQAWDPLEHRAINELKFLSADDIEAMAEPVYPLNLPQFLNHLRLVGRPEEPWYEEGRDDKPQNNPPMPD